MKSSDEVADHADDVDFPCNILSIPHACGQASPTAVQILWIRDEVWQRLDQRAEEVTGSNWPDCHRVNSCMTAVAMAAGVRDVA